MKLVKNALAKIKTSFDTLKRFWEIQELECATLFELNEETGDKLQKLQVSQNEIYKNHSASKIHETTVRWMALFKINHDAYISIEVNFFIVKIESIRYLER